MTQVPIAIEPPSPTASLLVRRVLGFGVWVAIGLAPFLGRARVPLFTAVIEMYPESLQNWLIPLSGLFMGMIAVVVEFAAGETPARRKITFSFIAAVVVFAGALIWLIDAYGNSVVRVEKTVMREDGNPDVVAMPVVTGTLEVPAGRKQCGCEEGIPAAECLTNITLEPKRVARCFDPKVMAAATKKLSLLYLLVTGAFAAAIGLLLLSQRSRAPATINA
jgi:hypothetical protein